ncbi:MAG: DUF427 domain-containing protein [Gemmobacter sp.]
MADHIRIRTAPGTWVVRAGGAVVGESARVQELTEGGMAAVMYFPRADIAMAMLDRSDRSSTCPWKGQASYFSVVTPEGRLDNAVWSYEMPKAGLEAIAGHLAFYTDRITVERLD